MRRRVRGSLPSTFELNLTPLLDVILQLITFFMMLVYFGSRIEGEAKSVRLPIAPAHDLGDLDRATQQTSPPLAPPKPVDLWRELARLVDPRLVAGTDWPALAGALDRAHRSGYDIERHLPRLAAQEPLPDERPARTLQYRLVDDCPASIRTVPARTQQQIDRERIEQARQRMATPEPGHGSSHSPAERPSAGGVRR